MNDHIAKMKQMMAKIRQTTNEDGFVVAALYKFADLPDYRDSTGGSAVVRRCWALGTILIAKEGLERYHLRP